MPKLPASPQNEMWWCPALSLTLCRCVRSAVAPWRSSNSCSAVCWTANPHLRRSFWCGEVDRATYTVSSNGSSHDVDQACTVAAGQHRQGEVGSYIPPVLQQPIHRRRCNAHLCRSNGPIQGPLDYITWLRCLSGRSPWLLCTPAVPCHIKLFAVTTHSCMSSRSVC